MRVAHRVEQGVATVRLEDPEHRNALSRALSDQLADAVDDCLGVGAKAIVVTAAPPVFCAGGSLDDLGRKDRPLKEAYRGYLALANAPVPTLAAVDGAAIGAGVNLVLACDVVLVTHRAVIDPRFLDVGIHPGGGHLWRLQRRIGVQGAAALVLFGDRLEGQEIVEARLAWKCVAPRELEERAMAMARRVADRPDALVARTKASLGESAAMRDQTEAFALELAAQEWSVAQPFFTQTLEALKQRIRGS